MAGGDGSQALVASVAAQAGIPYVCVPAGTRNHFALDLGLNRDDVVGALDAFADGVEQRIDLATVNGRTFVNNASLGLYAKVVQSPEYRDAKLRTAAAMLPDLLGPAADPLDLCFTGPGGEEHQTAQLILISNNPYQLVPMEGGAGTREQLDTGLLGIVAVTISDAAAADAFFALQALGQASRYAGWMEWAAPRFEITSAAEVEIGVDGEALRMTRRWSSRLSRGRCGSGCPGTRCASHRPRAPCTCCPGPPSPELGPGGGRGEPDAHSEPAVGQSGQP